MGIGAGMRHLRVVSAAVVAFAIVASVWSSAGPASADDGSAQQTVDQLSRQAQQEQERLDQLTGDASRAQSVLARKSQELRTLEIKETAVHGEMQAVARIEYQRPALTL